MGFIYANKRCALLMRLGSISRKGVNASQKEGNKENCETGEQEKTVRQGNKESCEENCKRGRKENCETGA